jgi:hypothetical protein
MSAVSIRWCDEESSRHHEFSDGATKNHRTITSSVVQCEVAVAIADRGLPSKTHTLGSD